MTQVILIELLDFRSWEVRSYGCINLAVLILFETCLAESSSNAPLFRKLDGTVVAEPPSPYPHLL